MTSPPPDPSNGYEAVASAFICSRERRRIGAGMIQGWSQSIPTGASVLDLGCGSGVPVSQALLAARLDVYAVDASAAMVAAFRTHFPTVPVECAAIEDSTFFGKTFDGVVACGLLFLLAEDTQREVIRKVAAVLRAGGQFLFTSPSQPCTWNDAMTGRASVSLGRLEYQNQLRLREGYSLTSGGTRDKIITTSRRSFKEFLQMRSRN